MVETISPVVHGGRRRWLEMVALHAIGATATAAAFGAVLGWIGGLLGAPWGRPGAVAIAAVAAVYALGEHPRVRVPVPQLRRQVPDWWRTFFRHRVAALLYGAGLGVGFLTFLAHGTLVVVAVAVVAIGRPLVGVLLMAPFGLVRGLSAWTARGSSTPEAGRALVDRLVSAPAGPRRRANALALALIVASMVRIAPATPPGHWWRLSAAALALALGWASASKLVGPRRWKAAIAAHRLPDRLASAAVWGIPLAEAVVPGLIVLGRPRAGAVVALVLLTIFSVELTRGRIRALGAVPCGCFGGRSAIPVRTALARNAALAASAALVLAGGRDDPVVALPGLPHGGEVLPMVLATTGMAVAALTAWRATTWLSRGRSA